MSILLQAAEVIEQDWRDGRRGFSTSLAIRHSVSDSHAGRAETLLKAST
jgi:hypothetical protein